MDKAEFLSLIKRVSNWTNFNARSGRRKNATFYASTIYTETNQLLICTNDIENGSEGGSMIYTVEGFAKGHQSYQFQS